MRKTVAISILFLLTLAFSAQAAAANDSGKLRHSGFYLAPGLVMASTPLFRQPSGNSEAAVPQKDSSVFLAGGWERSLRTIVFGLRLAYWRNAYENFRYPQMANSPYPVYVQYSDPVKTYFSGDIIAGWIPDKAGMFALYGLLGLGMNSETYTLAGSDFPQWDGAQSYSEFFYSYGLGVKVTPVRPLSLYAEMRFIPGVSSAKLKYLYSDSEYDYYEFLGTYTSNHTTAFTVGLTVNL